MDSLEATLGPIRFWRAPPPPSRPAPRPHIVSTAVFRFASAYRAPTKYAQGLARLAIAVRTHLPRFTLRVYADRSVDPRAIRGSGAPDAAREAHMWEECFASLAHSGVAEVVWFHAEAFRAPGGALGHQDLFGTMLRFVPLFDTTGLLPPWCGSPPDGSVVFVSDVDFKDLTNEHFMIHFVAWFGRVTDEGASSGAAPLRAEDAVPELTAMSFTGSAAQRHMPTGSLPPFVANCLSTRVRFPASWFTAFIDDALRGEAGTLLARYRGALHDPRNRNFTYSKRRVGEQQHFPFGVDEFMLTTALKPRAAARSDRPPAHWLFLILPNVDMVVLKALTLAEAAVEAAAGGALTDAPAIQRLVGAAAAAAGEVTGGDALALERLRRAAKDWPAAAAARAHLWGSYRGGRLLAASPGATAPAAADLRALVAATVEALASGAVPHKGEDLDQAMQNMDILGRIAPGVVGALSFTIGCGRIVAVEGVSERGADLLQSLRAVEGCTVPFPPHGISAAEGGVFFATPAVVDAMTRTGGAAAGPPGTAAPPPAAAAAVQLSVAAAAAAAVSGSKRSRTEETQAAGAGDGGGAPTPAPAAAAWELRVSRSTGAKYWFSAASGQSLWHDAALPSGWAFERSAADGPKTYVSLVTGQRQGEPPPG